MTLSDGGENMIEYKYNPRDYFNLWHDTMQIMKEKEQKREAINEGVLFLESES